MNGIAKFLSLAALTAVLPHFVARAEITDKDLENILGVNLKAAKTVSWKDWANSNPAFGHPQGEFGVPACAPDLPVEGGLQACCNYSTDCNESLYLACQNGTCLCKDGYLPSTVSGFCERRPKLGESCNIGDTCWNFEAPCVNFTCACPNTTVQGGEDCVTTETSWRVYIEFSTIITADGCLSPVGTKKKFGYCCKNESNCNSQLGLVCVDGMCQCKEDYYLNDAPFERSACDHRPRKKLGEKCHSMDNCYAAFAWCAEGGGICKCKPGFVQVNDTCRPREYSCPFKRPWTLKGTTIPWPCLPNSNRTGCPKDYTCLTPDAGARPRFLTRSGVEQSYCCPPVPDLNMTAIIEKFSDEGQQVPPDFFEPICLYGQACISDCQMDGPNASYSFPGIGMGTVTCLLPCIKHPLKQPVIRDGKCAGYDRYLRSDVS